MKCFLFSFPFALLALVGLLLQSELPAFATDANPGDGVASVDYEKQVKPILAHHCVTCHGPIKQEAGLRLDAGSLILKGSDVGAVVRRHDAHDSSLIERVSSPDLDVRMPPEGAALNSLEIETLRNWIAAGAPFPDNEEIIDVREHWFHRVPIKVTPPISAGYEGLTHPIDQFIAAGWVKSGLKPQPPADPSLLLRRLTLDLTGLPPLPEEVTAFEEAYRVNPATAIAEATDRLLATPAYGIRWGRHFMDIWRYCDEMLDSCGSGSPMIGHYHQWQWRDWIIESLNAGKGYDRMIVEMLAGDELSPEDPEALRATGYITRNYTTLGGRDVWLTDTLEHTAQAFLGTTMKCCRCHDHKYDPVSQIEYYNFRAIFTPIGARLDAIPGTPNPRDKGISRIFDEDPAARSVFYKDGNPQTPDESTPVAPGVPKMFNAGQLDIQPREIPPVAARPGLLPHVRQARLTVVRSDLARNQAELAALGDEGEFPSELAMKRRTMIKARIAKSEAELLAIEASIRTDDLRASESPEAEATGAEAASILRAFLVAEASTLVTEVDYALAEAKAKADGSASGEVIAAENRLVEVSKKLSQLKDEHEKSPATYVSLWPEYPLTSSGRRLALARWMTARQNPATARVLVNHVWMRHFGRPLVDTVFEFGLHGRRPTHQVLLDWLAVDFMEHGWDLKHLHRQILTSMVWQQSSSRQSQGDNDKKDPDNHYLWRANSQRLQAEQVRDSIIFLSGRLETQMGGAPEEPAKSDRVFRRSVYFRHTLEKGDKMLQMFDAPDPSECYRRQESIIPQQALVLANSRLTFEHARIVAGLLCNTPIDDETFVRSAFQRLICRNPSSVEMKFCLDYLQACSIITSGADDQPLAVEKDPLIAASTDPVQRARESLVQVLFNHTDFVTIR